MAAARATLRIVGALAALAACGSGYAHHSYAQYDRCQSITVEGEIERVDWANPHVVVSLRLDDSTSYRVEWLAVSRLDSAGVSRALYVGDRVAVTGSRNRDPDVRVMTLITEIDRPRDDWRWHRSPAPPSNQCAD